MSRQETSFIEDLASRWEALMDWFDVRLGPFFEANVEKVWFPPLFWALAAPVGLSLPLYFIGRLNPLTVIASVLLGVAFGFYLPHISLKEGRIHRLQRAWEEKSDRLAARELGVAYMNGEPDIPQCRDVARQWFLRAAEAGDRPSMLHLADLMSWGLGGEKDLEGAQYWTRKARS